jgi:ankyrin repeat protein
MFALYCGHESLAREIADRRGADYDEFEAAAFGDLRSIHRHLSQPTYIVDARSPDGFTALGLASFFGQEPVAEALLERGADPCVISANSLAVAPLHSALAGGHVKLGMKLIDASANPNIAAGSGWTPLHYAAQIGDCELVEMLLDKGARHDAKNAEGQTPDVIAQDKGNSFLAEIIRSGRRRR